MIVSSGAACWLMEMIPANLSLRILTQKTKKEKKQRFSRSAERTRASGYSFPLRNMSRGRELHLIVGAFRTSWPLFRVIKVHKTVVRLIHGAVLSPSEKQPCGTGVFLFPQAFPMNKQGSPFGRSNSIYPLLTA